MPHCLITGGAGFIGSHLAEALIADGNEVAVLDDLSGGSAERVPVQADLVVGSVTDSALVESLFVERRFDRVFHLAAFAAEAISHSVKSLNYATNVMGSINLVNAALLTEVKFFCFASSVAVYGHGETPMRESVTPVPVDSYGNAKLAVERELEVTMRLQGLPFTAFRMHNVYGEWQNMRDPYRNAVAIFFNQVMRCEPISVYGTGKQVRAFSYVGDVIDVLRRAPEVEAGWGRAFNVGSATTNTILELAKAVRVAAGEQDHPIVHLPARDEVMVAYTATDEARSVFGDWTDTGLAEGLERTAKWALGHGPTELWSSFGIEIGGSRVPEWARHVEARLQGADRSGGRSAGPMDPAEMRRRAQELAPWVNDFVYQGVSVASGSGQDYLLGQQPADRARAFYSAFPDTRTVLELGALEGADTLALSGAPGVTVLALEGRADNVRRAEFVMAVNGVENVELRLADVEQIDLASLGRFDAVLCAGLLYHLAEPWRLLRDIASISPRLYLSTHYWGCSETLDTMAGYAIKAVREEHPEPQARGLSVAVRWLDRDSLFAALADAGFVDVEILHERVSDEVCDIVATCTTAEGRRITEGTVTS